MFSGDLVPYNLSDKSFFLPEFIKGFVYGVNENSILVVAKYKYGFKTINIILNK